MDNEKEMELEDSNDNTSVADTLSELTTGIPKPIMRSAYKAFHRLLLAAVEYPAAIMESKTNEYKAESKARVAILENSARQMTQQMQVPPELAQAAAEKFAKKIIRETLNVEQIGKIAAKELKSTPASDTMPEKEISDDWLNAFEEEASKMSSEEMQNLFGKILAKEISAPQSFSIKTIKLMSQLDNDAAVAFRNFCSLAITLNIPEASIFDSRVSALGGNANNNSLQKYGLSYSNLNILQEYGLITSDYNSYMHYGICTLVSNHINVLFNYNNKKYYLKPIKQVASIPEVKISGVALSKSGRELLPIVEKIHSEEYTQKLNEYFESLGYKMTEYI